MPSDKRNRSVYCYITEKIVKYYIKNCRCLSAGVEAVERGYRDSYFGNSEFSFKVLSSFHFLCQKHCYTHNHKSYSGKFDDSLSIAEETSVFLNL